MAEAPDPRIGTMLEGRYRVTERLAAGGMGVVYKGELTAIGKPVAVKFLHDALDAHPRRRQALPARGDGDEQAGAPEPGQRARLGARPRRAVSGDGLRVAASRSPRCSPAARCRRRARRGWRGRSSPACAHAHATHVVHRDLKPDNILLLDGVEGDFVKILDFGLAKVLRGGKTRRRRS